MAKCQMGTAHSRAVFVLFSLTLSLVSCDWIHDPDRVIDGTYYYRLFTSNTDDGQIPMDGKSGVGFMCYPSLAAATTPLSDTIMFNDMCNSGSAMRYVDLDGIHTLTGSLTQVGYRDGAPGEALFSAIHSGENQVNGITRTGDTYYIADTNNNAIREIDTEGSVTTIIRAAYLKSPVAVAVAADPTAYFISDETKIIQVTPFQGSLVPTDLITDISPGALVLTNGNLYFANKDESIIGFSLSERTQRRVGNPEKMGYLNSLLLSRDETELLYYGRLNSGGGVFSLPVTASPTDVPTLKFEWPYKEPIVSFVPRSDDNSWIVLTTNDAYVVSIGEATTTTTTTTTTTEPPLPPIYQDREPIITAWPVSALPTNDSCLMSELYYWMRMDAEIAFGTDDYLTQFNPPLDEEMAIPGDVNVSAWCDNITARYSNDGTILILDFWGPVNMTDAQQRLNDSPWFHTREFLKKLRDEGWPLDPLCLYNCGDKCVDMTASPDLCIDYVYVRCDDICMGAIASSAVMGTTLLVLVVLMIASPSNLFTAFVMLPIL